MFLIGRLTKEPELRKTKSNMSVCSFILANNTAKKNEQGEYIANFIPITAWGKQAEFIANYLHKGSLICVDATISTSSYDSPEGRKYRMDIMANSVQALESRKRNGDDLIVGKADGGTFEIDDPVPKNGNVNISPDDLPFF